MRKNQYNLHIRLDEDERAALEKGLQASGLPLSAYLRKLILGESIQAAPSEELRRLRAEIHQIGNNINQLARKANAGFASRDEVTRALRMLDRVYQTPERAQREVYYAGKEELLMNIKRKSLTQMRPPTALKADDYMSSYGDK